MLWKSVGWHLDHECIKSRHNQLKYLTPRLVIPKSFTSLTKTWWTDARLEEKISWNTCKASYYWGWWRKQVLTVTSTGVIFMIPHAGSLRGLLGVELGDEVSWLPRGPNSDMLRPSSCIIGVLSCWWDMAIPDGGVSTGASFAFISSNFPSNRLPHHPYQEPCSNQIWHLRFTIMLCSPYGILKENKKNWCLMIIVELKGHWKKRRPD
jgi:hypothetical protein